MPVFISSLERDRLGTATSHDGFHEKLTQQGRRKELRKKKKSAQWGHFIALSLFSNIDPCTKNMTQVNWKFLLMKSSKKYSIFLPAFYPIMLLMTSPKNFEKIAILKIWQLFSSELSKLTLANYHWNKAFSGMTKIDFHQYCPRNSYCAH